MLEIASLVECQETPKISYDFLFYILVYMTIQQSETPNG